MTTTQATNQNDDAQPYAPWRGAAMGTTVALIVSAAISALAFGSVNWVAIGEAMAMVLAYGLAGHVCNRLAMRSGTVGMIGWGIGVKFSRSILFTAVGFALILLQMVDTGPFVLTLGIGWLACLVQDVLSINFAPSSAARTATSHPYVTS